MLRLCEHIEEHQFLCPQGPLVRWLKVNFSECFICWTHVKAIRVFVESVLRQAYLICVLCLNEVIEVWLVRLQLCVYG